MKRYAQLLHRAIEESGKTLKDISNECHERGVKISIASLSKMRTGEQAPPPEPEPGVHETSKNKVLAEVLRVRKTLGITEDDFVAQGALEHTPPIVIRHLVGTLGILSLRQLLDTNDLVRQARVALEVTYKTHPNKESLGTAYDELRELVAKAGDSAFEMSALLRFHLQGLRDLYVQLSGEPFPNILDIKSDQTETVGGLVRLLSEASGIQETVLSAFVNALSQQRTPALDETPAE